MGNFARLSAVLPSRFPVVLPKRPAMQINRLVLIVALPLVSGFLGANQSQSKEPVRFKVQMLALDANEGIAAGDVDGDGKTDLVAGRQWFRGGDWAPRPLRNISDWNGYVESNGDYLFDVNKDGRLDVVAGSFLPSEVFWYENPGDEALRLGKQWPQHLLKDTQRSQNEGQLLEDVDGDGTPEWIVNSWKKDVPMMVYRFVDRGVPGAGQANAKGTAKQGAAKKNKAGSTKNTAKYDLVGHSLGDKANGHGVAIGDLNGDGRKDILVGQGWYEQPESKIWQSEWTFHADWDLHSSLPMIVTDLDDDGDSDLIIGNGHDYGLYWWEQTGLDAQTGKLSFEKHDIDNQYSQPHTLAWADLDGDGTKDLITGKRYYAHNSRDPGGTEPPCLYYYTFDTDAKKFSRHVIDEGHVGSGLQIVVEDLNQDGKTDLAVAGKSGTYLLLAE